MSTRTKVIIGIVVVVAVIVLPAIVFAATKDKGEKSDAERKREYDPRNPETGTPVQGRAYAVQSGDSEFRILQEAGFPKAKVYAGFKAMRDDPEHTWIGHTTMYGQKQLGLFQKFDPADNEKPGQYWAYKTKREKRSSTRRRFPVVRVPRADEV